MIQHLLYQTISGVNHHGLASSVGGLKTEIDRQEVYWEYSWDQHLWRKEKQGNRIGQREKLAVTKPLADPVGSSKAGLALENCPMWH